MDAPIINASETVANVNKVKKGRGPSIPSAQFVSEYQQLVKDGLSYPEMATHWGITTSSVIQKRQAANTKLKAYGKALPLPTRTITGAVGRKKLDWAVLSEKVEASVQE